MFRTTLHSVLLLAVAYSQILGGVSCCCLGRSLLESISGTPHAVATDGAPSKSVATQQAPCPKCAARPTGKTDEAVRSATKTSRPLHLGTCQGGQCNCSKLVLNASEPPESVSVPAKTIAWASVAVGSHKPVAISLSNFGKFEVPIRFGGRSWQSIACVWKN